MQTVSKLPRLSGGDTESVLYKNNFYSYAMQLR